jgi:hypothetical protein
MAKKKATTNSNLDKLRDAFKNSGSNGNVRWWRPDWGDNSIRILPPINSDDLFYLETATHYIDGVRYQCLTYEIDEETGKAKKCPICEARKKMFRVGRKDIAKDIKGKLQYLMNIVERKGEDKNKVKVWGAGVKVWKKMVKDMLDDDLVIYDPVDGYDFIVSKEEGAKTEEGTYPSYDASKIARRSTPLSSDEKEIEEILENRNDFNEIVKFESEEVLQSAVDAYINSVLNVQDNEEFYEKEDDDKKEVNVGKSKLDDFKKKLAAKMDEE